MSVIKLIGAPGSIAFLIFCGAVGLGLRYVWPRSRQLGRAWVASVLILYAVLALPPVANTIAGALPAVRSNPTRRADVLVVFDGDNRRGRVREALAAYRAWSPDVVSVLGEEWVVDALIEGGLPPSQIAHDTTPTSTRAQIVAVQGMQASTPARRLGIVASRLQMPRVAALADAAGLDVVLLTSAVDDEPPTTGGARFVPAYIALRVSRDAIYEHAALAYYQWRGWIDAVSAAAGAAGRAEPQSGWHGAPGGRARHAPPCRHADDGVLSR